MWDAVTVSYVGNIVQYYNFMMVILGRLSEVGKWSWEWDTEDSESFFHRFWQVYNHLKIM